MQDRINTYASDIETLKTNLKLTTVNQIADDLLALLLEEKNLKEIKTAALSKAIIDFVKNQIQLG